MSSTSRSEYACARHSSVQPSASSKSGSAKVEYLSRSTSPSSRKDLHAEHCPSLHPCMSMMPWRKAALRTVSSSSASISMPTGSNRTVCVLPMTWRSFAANAGPRTRSLPGWVGPNPRPAPPSGVRRRAASGRSALRRRAPRGPARPVARHVGLALLGRHLVEEDVGRLERDALRLVQRPHLLRIEVQVRLRDERVPVVADVPEVLHDLREVLAMVQGLPLALPGQASHGRRRAALVVGPERDLVGPVARLGAVRPNLAVDLVDDRVLTDQARHHARPAAVRVLVLGAGLERDRLMAVLDRVVVVALPPLAVLVVPAGVLVLEPLEVLVRHAVDPPVVGEPAGREELSDLVDVALVPDAVPGFLDQIVRDRQAVLLERDQVRAVVVVVDPTPPHLGVALAVLAAVLRAVLDEGADGGVDDRVVVPLRVAEIALEQLAVALVGERHE